MLKCPHCAHGLGFNAQSSPIIHVRVINVRALKLILHAAKRIERQVVHAYVPFCIWFACNIFLLHKCTYFISCCSWVVFPSVLWQCWLGIRKSIQPVKCWVIGCWRGYLSGARCKWFAYSLADATATPSSLALLNKVQIGLTSLCWLTQVVLEKKPLNGCLSVLQLWCECGDGACGQDCDDDINSEVDLMMSSDIVVASLSTKHVTFNRLRSGWLFREDRTVFQRICSCRKLPPHWPIDCMLLSTFTRFTLCHFLLSLWHHSHYDVICASRTYGHRSPHSHYDAILIMTSMALAAPFLLWRHFYCDFICYWAGHAQHYRHTLQTYVQTPYRVYYIEII